ncbi:MAG: EAL domain-containing protein [Candidatus Contendobacter sp.]|nr:EAL domain-containing protein [Candidatus Contendobacter sp.]MDS4059602.1 EAL domain-containing protein [Candidatus Contendobacter sp.]
MFLFRLHRNITLKFIAYLMFLSVIPLLVLGITAYHISRNILQAEAQRYTLQLLRSQRDYLELQLDQVEALLANIAGVETILEALDDPRPRTDVYTRLATQARIGYILNNYLNLKGLISIDIFTRDGDHYHVGDTLDVGQVDTAAVQRLWQSARDSERLVWWAGVERNVNTHSTHGQVITATKVLRRMNRETLTQEPLALLLANYSVDELYDRFHRTDLGEDAYIQIVDQRGRVIYHPDRTLIGSRIDAPLWHVNAEPEMSLTAIITGQPYTISHVAVPRNGWYLESIIPNRTLAAKAVQIQRNTALLLSACFGMVGLAALLYSRRVVQPIRAIIDSFKQLQGNSLDPQARLVARSRDEIGELTRWFNAFMDNLAARQASEQALRDSEMRYSLAVRGANDGLWDWDLRHRQLYLSARFKDMLGYAEHELSADPTEWLSRIHAEDRDRFNAALTAHLAGDAPYFECEHRLRRKDDRYFWALGRGLAVRDATGQPYRMAGSSTDIDSRKHSEDQLRHHALHDTLTELPNRVAFLDYVRRAIERHKRHPDHGYAVLFLDLDHFKLINDTQGHSAGDALLVEVARRLRGVIRATDVLARLGGDEFVLLLEDMIDVHDVTDTANRLLLALAPPFAFKEQIPVTVSASIGIAIGSSAYETPEQLLRDADIAMYRAKALGKTRYELFDIVMRDQIVRRLALETELKRALELGEFRLWYQPIIALESWQLHGFEALLRWQHPERGLLTPGEFMQVIEEIGLIVPLGIWVLEEVCRQFADWRHRYTSAAALKISVNLSAKQFQHASFVQRAMAILAATGIPAAALAVEVTETALVQDTEVAAAMLKQLEILGFEIHMDDFGTGYSSLSYLDSFQVDAIKIDRSFVAKIANRREDFSLIKTLIALGREMRIKVIAEGIETEEQLAYLIAHGCQYGQGYHLYRPLAPSVIEAMFEGAMVR